MHRMLKYVVAIPVLSAFVLVGCQREPLTADKALRRLKSHASEGNLDRMQAVIAQFPHVLSEAGEMQETALHYAAIAATPDVISFLVFAGADINARNKYGYTPLWSAVLHRKTDSVQQLLELSADLHIPSAKNAPLDGVMPLELAANRRCPDIVRLLLKHGADVNRLRPDRSVAASALHWAAFQNDPESVDVLLDCGADPNLTTEAGLTPLMMVVHRGLSGKDIPETEADIKIVKSLLAAGASCDAEFVNGETPVSFSQKHKNLLPEVSKLLAAAAEAKGQSARVEETESQPGVD